MPAEKETIGRHNPSHQPSSRRTEEGERFDRTLFATVEALDREKIPYGVIGGVAAGGLGRPRSTHDIDIFVKPEDAESTLEALSRSGFTTEKTDYNWLFKAWRENILVDVVFKSSPDIYFDEEMQARGVLVDYHGRKIRVVPPEDFIIIKSAVHSEIGPHHWHDALSVLAHATVEWDYLLRRARRASRRMLALLIYAQSNDILIPNRVIHELFRRLYGTQATETEGPIWRAPMTPSVMERAAMGEIKRPEAYLAGQIREAINRDPRIGEQNIQINVEGNHVLLRGECTTAGQREILEDVIHHVTPGLRIDNRVTVPELREPEGSEKVV